MSANSWAGERAGAFTPDAEMLSHAGTPLLPEMDFFVAPPAEIGKVVTAWTTLKKTKAPWSAVSRLMLAFGLALVVCVAGEIFTQNVMSEIPLVGRSIYGAVAFIAMLAGWMMTSFRAVCTYAGTLGVARYSLSGNRENPAVGKIFCYGDGAELRTSQTHNYYNGVYTGTIYKYRWTNSEGRELFKLAGNYHSQQGTPKPASEFHFAQASETYWSMYLLDRVNEQLDKEGFVQFGLSGGDFIRVGRGFLEFVRKGTTARITPDEIKELRLSDGTFLVTHKDAKWWSSKGHFKFQYATMANARVFLMALESLLGYTFS